MLSMTFQTRLNILIKKSNVYRFTVGYKEKFMTQNDKYNGLSKIRRLPT